MPKQINLKRSLTFGAMSGLVVVTTIANADWTYKTRITLLPDPSVSVASKVKGALAIPHSIASKANIRSLTKAFSVEKAGFSIDGKTTVSFDAKGGFISQPVPNLSDVSHPGRRTELCDGVNIYTNDGQTGQVIPGNQLYGLTSPPGQILLGRFEPPSKTITSLDTTSRTFEIKEYSGAVRTVRTKSSYSADGRVGSIALYFSDGTPIQPIAIYDVKSYDQKGNPTSILVTYFKSGGGPAYRREEYTLLTSTAAQEKYPSDVFSIGETIIDERLGTAPPDQVSYLWTGTLPSITTLRLRNKPLTLFTQNRPAARWMLGVVGLMLGSGTWLMFRRRVKTAMSASS